MKLLYLTGTRSQSLCHFWHFPFALWNVYSATRLHSISSLPPSLSISFSLHWIKRKKMAVLWESRAHGRCALIPDAAGMAALLPNDFSKTLLIFAWQTKLAPHQHFTAHHAKYYTSKFSTVRLVQNDDGFLAENPMCCAAEPCCTIVVPCWRDTPNTVRLMNKTENVYVNENKMILCVCRIVHRTYTCANNDQLEDAWMPRFRCKLNSFANATQHAYCTTMASLEPMTWIFWRLCGVYFLVDVWIRQKLATTTHRHTYLRETIVNYLCVCLHAVRLFIH